MKRWTHRHQPRLITEISVTPLLDLVFVLLLVFMITAPLMNQDSNLALPLSETAQAEPAAKNVARLSLNREQELALDGTRLELSELVAAIKQKSVGLPHLAVVVEIHRELPVQRLVELMDKLTEAGVQKTSVVASDAEGPKS